MISVIVPIYKVEKYLRRCVDSILNQSYTDFELLLIDDGSPDSCPQICDEYARRDDRVRVFHKPNGGLSDARNYGVERMKGDYVSFIDSDDYVGPDYLKILMELIGEYQVPVAAVAHLCVFDDGTSFAASQDTRYVIPNDGIMKAMAQGQIIFSAWGKLMRRDLFAQARFPVGYLFNEMLSLRRVRHEAATADSFRKTGDVCATRCIYRRFYESVYFFHSGIFSEIMAATVPHSRR